MQLPAYQSVDGSLLADGPPPSAILSGSFNPLHEGHVGLAAAAEAVLGVAVAFELSVRNVDKPALKESDVSRRLRQFVGVRAVWVTDAPTFAEKSELFPAVTFVLGYDTAARLADPRYHGGDPAERDAVFGRLRERGCRLLVAGRRDAGGNFLSSESLPVPGGFEGLYRHLSESEFRVDVSSTELRRRGG